MGGLTGDATGILAIWNDCAPGHQETYEAWYQGEHLAERVAIPGIRVGRRYESLDGGSPRFFTYYETSSPAVLRSAAYLERLDDPTPLTRKIMSGIFLNMSRTVCDRVWHAGDMTGSFAVTAKLTAEIDDDNVRSLGDDIGCARVEKWWAAAERDDLVRVRCALIFPEMAAWNDQGCAILFREVGEGPHGSNG